MCFMGIEENIQRSLFSSNPEKTFIDKILAKEDVKRVKDLMRKSKLEREDLLELLYLLTGNESKLLNYGEWDRYVALKFFVWIREFIKVAELLYDYQDDLKKRNKENKEGESEIDDITQQMLDNNERLIEHNAKFLIDLYFNIGRTTLSLGATGIMELLKTKFEIVYPSPTLGTTPETGVRAIKT